LEISQLLLIHMTKKRFLFWGVPILSWSSIRPLFKLFPVVFKLMKPTGKRGFYFYSG